MKVTIQNLMDLYKRTGPQNAELYTLRQMGDKVALDLMGKVSTPSKEMLDDNVEYWKELGWKELV